MKGCYYQTKDSFQSDNEPGGAILRFSREQGIGLNENNKRIYIKTALFRLLGLTVTK